MSARVHGNLTDSDCTNMGQGVWPAADPWDRSKDPSGRTAFLGRRDVRDMLIDKQVLMMVWRQSRHSCWGLKRSQVYETAWGKEQPRAYIVIAPIAVPCFDASLMRPFPISATPRSSGVCFFFFPFFADGIFVVRPVLHRRKIIEILPTSLRLTPGVASSVNAYKEAQIPVARDQQQGNTA